MKLLYFTMEDIDSGLFNNQVLEILYCLLDRMPGIEITLFVINKPSRYFKHKSKVEAIRKNIDIIYIPLSPPMRFYTYSIFFNKAYIFFLSIVFRLFAKPQNYDVIHCRHYVPALVCKKLGIANIHFDVRSLSLFEYVQAGKIRKGSKNYSYWKNQEKNLVKFAHGISGVSRSMIPYFKQECDKEIAYCPIIVNPNNVYFSPDFRHRLREDWEWSNETIYVYSGSFGLYGLNKNYLAKLIDLIIDLDSRSKFLFLLSNSKEEFSEFVSNFKFDKSSFKYFSVGPSDLYKYLSAGDIGIHALPPQLDSFTRLGVKIVEYWCCGMPTLINNNVGEAGEISKRYNFGHVVDLDNIKTGKNTSIDVTTFDRNYIREKSLEIFNKNIVIDSYIDSYQKILSKYHEGI